jgi:regulator of sigma E protease
VDTEKQRKNIETMIINIAPGSPGENSGFQVGDKILSIKSGENVYSVSEGLNVDNLQNFIIDNSEQKLEFTVDRFEEVKKIEVIAVDGIIEGRKAVGIQMADVGEIQIGFFESIWKGLTTTLIALEKISIELFKFLSSAVVGKANFNQVAGPVGLVGHVGDAAKFGFTNLLSFTAMISLNLAIINLIPFPALDGGRLLVVAIEGITRKQINVKFVNTLNIIGFALLMLLMISVTVSDIVKLF